MMKIQRKREREYRIQLFEGFCYLLPTFYVEHGYGNRAIKIGLLFLEITIVRHKKTH